jgi:hypothetical protein
MSAIIVSVETRAHREARRHRELIATYRAYIRAEAPMRWDALMQALDCFVAFQMRYGRPKCPPCRIGAVYACP